MANTRNERRNREDSSSNGTNGADIAQVMQAFIAALNANRPQPTNNSNNNPLAPLICMQALNEFCKRRPPVFHEELEPIMGEARLKNIKVILSTLGIEKNGHSVALAAYQLQEEARYGWELIESTHNVNTMTFEEFENLFLDKYFPASVK